MILDGAIAGSSATVPRIRRIQLVPCKMSEKRKPTIRLFAQVGGKSVKIELYPHELFQRVGLPTHANRYRVRVNGRWYGGKKIEFVTLSWVLTQLRTQLVRWERKRPTRATSEAAAGRPVATTEPTNKEA